MLTLTLLALVAEPAAAPVPFDAITAERAELDGQPVVIAFTVGSMPYTWGEGEAVRTWCGSVGVDDVERTVSLKGNRLKDADEGKKLGVSGLLRLIRHPAAVVAGIEVPAWVEIRAEE